MLLNQINGQLFSAIAAPFNCLVYIDDNEDVWLNDCELFF